MNRYLARAVVTLNKRLANEEDLITVEDGGIVFLEQALWEPGDLEPWTNNIDAAKWLREQIKEVISDINHLEWLLDLKEDSWSITLEEFQDQVPFRAPDDYGPQYGDLRQDNFSYAAWYENGKRYAASWVSSRTT